MKIKTIAMNSSNDSMEQENFPINSIKKTASCLEAQSVKEPTLEELSTDIDNDSNEYIDIEGVDSEDEQQVEVLPNAEIVQDRHQEIITKVLPTADQEVTAVTETKIPYQIKLLSPAIQVAGLIHTINQTTESNNIKQKVKPAPVAELAIVNHGNDVATVSDQAVVSKNVARLGAKADLNSDNTTSKTGNMEYKCNLCETVVQGFSFMLAHYKVIHSLSFPKNIKNFNVTPDINDPNFYCQACERFYKSKLSFKKHVKLGHFLSNSAVGGNFPNESIISPGGNFNRIAHKGVFMPNSAQIDRTREAKDANVSTDTDEKQIPAYLNKQQSTMSHRAQSMSMKSVNAKLDIRKAIPVTKLRQPAMALSDNFQMTLHPQKMIGNTEDQQSNANSNFQQMPVDSMAEQSFANLEALKTAVDTNNAHKKGVKSVSKQKASNPETDKNTVDKAAVKFYQIPAKPKFRCIICKSSFSNRPSYAAHLLVSHSLKLKKPISKGVIPDWNDMENKCKPCDETFPTKTYYHRHCQVIHNIINPNDPNLYCNICDETLEDLFTYRKHCLKIHKMKDLDDLVDIQCKFCSRILGTGKQYSSHLKRCKAKFKREELRQKDGITLIWDDPSLHCSVCNETFGSRAKFRLHLRKAHRITANNSGPVEPHYYYCFACDQGYLVKPMFCQHLRKIHGVQTNDLVLERCKILISPNVFPSPLDPKLYGSVMNLSV
ncbi:hypothetical protein BD408DRAFT_423801 [Parasitella parasitica]|nr:hypothetical protein BD408DRAFT_423801 [Parasitella parasitica]